jgi:hypothetical protein
MEVSGQFNGPLYPRRKRPQYSLIRMLWVFQIVSEHGGEKKCNFPLPGIEIRFPVRPFVA